MEKVSIIIPVYNAEKYITKCVESVLSQTYNNIEVILVDDGSTDNSAAICDEFKNADSRIIVIHKANGGASSARNSGLKVATGKYICFVDSDDLILPDSITLLVNAININEAEFAAGICKIAETGRAKNKINEDTLLEIEKNNKEIMKYITSSGSYSPYAKLFRLDIILNNKIFFDEELKCSEDALFIRTYLTKTKRIALVSQLVYSYTSSNTNSLSKKRYENYCEYYVKKMQSLELLAEHMQLDIEEKKQFLAERAIHGLHISINHYMRHWCSIEDRKRLLMKSVNLLNEWLVLYDRKNENTFTINKKTLLWYRKSIDLINQGKTERFYNTQARIYRKELVKERIYRIIKKLLRK